MRNKTLIEINGKQYDAITGQVISDRQAPAHQEAPKVIEGVAHPQARPVPHKVPTAAHSGIRPPKPHHRAPAGHVAHHAPQRSHTLMRAAVKKPVGRRQRLVSDAHAPIFNTYAAKEVGNQESFRHPLHAARIERAKTIGKSGLVSKYHPHSTTVIRTTAAVPVKPAPSHPPHAIHHVNTALSHHKQNDLFGHAIEQANSHRQPAVGQPKHHRLARKAGMSNKQLTIITSALAVVLLAGVVAYQKLPTFTMRVAAAKAGFPATMPEYRPAGFVLADRVQHQPGEITVSYKSTSDGRAYKVTQRPSNWASETLLDQVITPTRQPYQTYQDNGRVIYIWGDNATWVDGGVWYQITGNSSLTSNQLLRIASSL